MTSPSDIPVIVVDDQAPFRRVAAAVVATTSGFALVGETDSGEGALDLVERFHPALVLMDITMPGIGGIEATRRIRRHHPDVNVVLLSTYQAADLPADASSCGALAYVHKEDFEPRMLEDVWRRHTRDGALPAGDTPGR